MTFLHLSLLAGSALIAVPIILHLIMRRKPTLLEFPAMRFLQKRADVNRRRLQLRHLLLLLLRMAAIALLAFALARPSMQLGGTLGSQEAPVAAALIFDAAPRMEYRHENQTRLESARELGLWLMAQLPEQSEIAVLDTRAGTSAAFQPDRGAARERVARMETVANSQPLPAVLNAAVQLLRQSSLPRKEIYVFTDLSRGGWPAAQSARLQQQLQSLGGVGLYVIDVGIAKPTDYGLDEVRLSGEVLSNRSALTVSSELSCVGAPAERTVELHLLDADRKPQKRSEQTVSAAPGELRPVEFRVGGLEPGVHQGFLRIVGQDGLAADDTRYFTVEVKPAWKVLVAAPKPAESYALFFTEALAPSVFRKRGQARFDCEICNLDELGKKQLSDFAAVCLLDPTPLEPAVWKKLAEFAAEGRGVGIFLGRNAQSVDSFNEPQAQELLPGKLLRQVRRPDGDVHLAPRNFQHPILAAFRSQAGGIPWDAFPVLRYWELGEAESVGKGDSPREQEGGQSPFPTVPEKKEGGQSSFPAGVNAVLHYSDGRPALLERPVGQGRSLTMTTPVSDRPNQSPWNLLPAGEAWPFLILTNQMLSYLVGSSDQQLNYLAGQTAVLQLDEAAQHQSFMFFAPGDLTFPISADLKRRQLTITATEQVGNYRLQAGGAGGTNLGFSVNYAPGQTRLDRLDEKELAEVFGPVKFRLAKTRQQIDRDVSMGRVGRELYPPLILIAALVLALELLVSNRFYRK